MIVKWIHSASRFLLGGQESRDPPGSQDPLEGRWVGLLPVSSLCLRGQSMDTPLSRYAQLLPLLLGQFPLFCAREKMGSIKYISWEDGNGGRAWKISQKWGFSFKVFSFVFIDLISWEVGHMSWHTWRGQRTTLGVGSLPVLCGSLWLNSGHGA